MKCSRWFFAVLVVLLICSMLHAQPFDFRTVGTLTTTQLNFRSWAGSPFGTPPPVSAPGFGKLYFDQATGLFKISQNGGAWMDLYRAAGTGVTSFNARIGDVAPTSGDYAATQVTSTAIGAVTATTVQGAIAQLEALASAASAGVSSFNGRTGSVSPIQADYDSFFTTISEAAAAAPVQSVAGRTGAVTVAVADVSGAAPTASPTLTGDPKSVTPSGGDNDTSIATTAFVQTAVGGVSVPVTSVFGRTGAVVAASGDYTATQVTNAVTTNTTQTISGAKTFTTDQTFNSIFSSGWNQNSLTATTAANVGTISTWDGRHHVLAADSLTNTANGLAAAVDDNGNGILYARKPGTAWRDLRIQPSAGNGTTSIWGSSLASTVALSVNGPTYIKSYASSVTVPTLITSEYGVSVGDRQGATFHIFEGRNYLDNTTSFVDSTGNMTLSGAASVVSLTATGGTSTFNNVLGGGSGVALNVYGRTSNGLFAQNSSTSTSTTVRIQEGSGGQAAGTKMFDVVNDSSATVFSVDKAGVVAASHVGFNSTTDAGIVANSLTTTQRDALSSPSDGSIVYNSTTNLFDFRTASAWYNFCRTTGCSYSGQVMFPTSSAGTPAWGMGSSTTSGPYDSSGKIEWSIVGSQKFEMSANNFGLIGSTTGISFANGSFLHSLSANNVGISNGASAQTFRVYNTTDSNTAPTNYEWAGVTWSSNIAQFRVTKGGTGASRNMQLFADGNIYIIGDTNSSTTNTIRDIGFNNLSSGLTRHSNMNGNAVYDQVAPSGGGNYYNWTQAVKSELKASSATAMCWGQGMTLSTLSGGTNYLCFDTSSAIINHGVGVQYSRATCTTHTCTGTYDHLQHINPSTGAATAYTLPAVKDGVELVIKDAKGDAGTNNITITPASGNVDGAANVVISTNYGKVTVYSDGTNWFTE